MFVSWALLSGLAGDLHTDELPDDLEKLRSRSVTPGQFFLSVGDGKFTDEDLSDEGNAFAEAYFSSEDGSYLSDYEQVLVGDLAPQYHVADTWENYARDTRVPCSRCRGAAARVPAST